MIQGQDNILLSQQFETIFSGYYSAVKYFALMLLKSKTDAEDITQDVFIKLWGQPQVWANRNKGEIANYIFAMTKHITINFIRHKRIVEDYRESVIEKSLIEELLQPDEALESIYYKEAELLVRLVLSRLPERRREIFVLSRFKNMSNQEIAEKLDISVRTVEHHIYQTLVELKKTIFIAFFFYFM